MLSSENIVMKIHGIYYFIQSLRHLILFTAPFYLAHSGVWGHW